MAKASDSIFTHEMIRGAVSRCEWKHRLLSLGRRRVTTDEGGMSVLWYRWRGHAVVLRVLPTLAGDES